MVLGAAVAHRQPLMYTLLYRNRLETDNKKVFSVGGTDTLAGRSYDGYTTTTTRHSLRRFLTIFDAFDNI